MLHTPENALSKILLDARGKKVPGVMSFDDETHEVELLVLNQDHHVVMTADLDENNEFKYKPLVIKTNMPGAKLVSLEEYAKIENSNS